MDRIDIQTVLLAGADIGISLPQEPTLAPARRSAARADAAERILRDYARCWGRLDRVVYQVSLTGFKERFPDMADDEANEYVARAALRTIAREPALFWRDAPRAAKAQRS